MHHLDRENKTEKTKVICPKLLKAMAKNHRTKESWLLLPCFSSSFKRKAVPVCKAPAKEMAAPEPFHTQVGKGLDCPQCPQTFCILLITSPNAKPQKPAHDWKLGNLSVSSLLLSLAVTSGSEGSAFQTGACIYLIMEINSEVLLGKNPSLSGILME